MKIKDHLKLVYDEKVHGQLARDLCAQIFTMYQDALQKGLDVYAVKDILMNLTANLVLNINLLEAETIDIDNLDAKLFYELSEYYSELCDQYAYYMNVPEEEL